MNNSAALAQKTFQTLCSMLDRKGWVYKKHEDTLHIFSEAQGEDLPIPIRILVDSDLCVVSLLSQLPFTMSKDHLTDGAIAICIINYELVEGSFDYNVQNGAIFFRMTTNFRQSQISEALFDDILRTSLCIVDKYNDKLFQLSEGRITIDIFTAAFT